jgi:RNA polymerase sigma-70 factor (ECF subfamily)
LTGTSDDIEDYFRAHYARLVRALTLVCGSHELAADAVQEAFVKAHLRWRRISRYDDPIGWIRRVAINRLHDERRRRGRHDRAVDRLAVEVDDVVEPPHPSDVTDLTAAIADLPRQQRLAVALYYLEGLSVSETATTLELSDGAVKFHLHQARQRLRDALRGGDDRDG